MGYSHGSNVRLQKAFELLNSIIQAAKRKARGYKFEYFKEMAYLLTGKLDLHKVNPFLPT